MKKIYFFILFSIPILNYSQNWNLISLDNKYHYKADSLDFNSNTIFIDSFALVDNDTIFYLNRIVIDCFECDPNFPDKYKIANQGQFLQKEMRKFSNGSIRFSGDHEFFINPNLNTGQSWLFDTLQSIYANIDTIYEFELFGSLDSIKTVATDNGDTILISKNHGIVAFKNNDNNYILNGIEGQNVGELSPKKEDFFNFNIGDIFQYRKEDSTDIGPFSGIKKNTILDKVENDSQFIYSIKTLSRDTFIGSIYGEDFTSDVDTFNLIIDRNFDPHSPFTDYEDFLNKSYNNQIISTNNSPILQNIVKINKDPITQKISMGRGYYLHDYDFLNDSDTLIWNSIDIKRKDVYTVGMGNVFALNYFLEIFQETYLIGHVTNEDTTGIIIPDQDFIILIIDQDMDGFNDIVDCDDSNPQINPDAIEIPNNNIDENCDGIILIIFDQDMDGFNSDLDCDDSNPDINPNAVEIPNNSIDEDCDGVILIIDQDMDGFNNEEDCDDNNPYANPGAIEIPNNNLDEDCDGVILIIDQDMDGFNSYQDCDDDNPNINPDAVDIPNNNIDEDCDGVDLISDNINLLTISDIYFYPNPISDYMWIKSNSNFDAIMYLYNSLGLLVIKKKIQLSKSGIQINTRHIPTGIYYFEIVNQNTDLIYTNKVIKLR